VLAETAALSLWLPVDFELRPPLEVTEARFEGNRCLCKIRNNTQELRVVRGRISLAETAQLLNLTVPPLSAVPVEIVVNDSARLTPGTNTIMLAVEGASHPVIGQLVDWKLPLNPANAQPVSLSAFRNQDLATLHQQRYLNPRTPNYTMTVLENGRSWWLGRGKMPEPHLDLLKGAGGRLRSGIGVPFEVPANGLNACFTSIFENFPRKVQIPVGQDARKLYFLFVASTNQMQSRIENARFTVHAEDGTYVLPLINPNNLDDWLMPPFALSGYSQKFGPGTYGRILDMDLSEKKRVETVEVECLSNEVLFGVLGLTLVV
jgi:hypothetical protein